MWETSVWERNIDVRGKHQSVASCMVPDQGLNPQPKYMPWPGIQLETFWCMGQSPKQVTQLGLKSNKEHWTSWGSLCCIWTSNITWFSVSHCCVMPLWRETLFLLCLLGSLPPPHHLQQPLSPMSASKLLLSQGGCSTCWLKLLLSCTLHCSPQSRARLPPGYHHESDAIWEQSLPTLVPWPSWAYRPCFPSLQSAPHRFPHFLHVSHYLLVITHNKTGWTNLLLKN